MKSFVGRALLFIVFGISFVLPSMADQATSSPLYIEGTDYEVIATNSSIPSFPEKTITVTEFFSYGCPWCYELEPRLQAWRKPSYVDFNRVPVIFERNWDYYAKAYYIAQALGIEKKITPKLFNAIQEKNETLGSNNAMEKFFTEQGVRKSIAQTAFEASPTLDAEVKEGVRLMQAYQVYVVPTIVIDGKYRTDLRMAASDKKLISIVDFLIAKRKEEKHIG